ncbi:hypothetical protein FNF29_07061 [Cafeteria roenbergensis]|uniref:Protein MIS12 homolog n=1 Tax=Cafeteria roenbergensis TaxID=33653 RepID=A0A5A8C5C1_CAFRO|nr:hypothetical protein FNF29_07061 [Cafeteria roenbergensis]|eukprot:KAA0147847.1 hypothetical protein FNF29_07061 [Cafeteria roenbergensis]
MASLPPADSQQPSTAEARLLGFEPVSFVEDVYNCIDDYIADGMDSFERVLRSDLGESGLSEDESAELHRGCDTLVDRLRSTFDENVDKFEVYVLKNIFRIPDGVVIDDVVAARQPEEGTLPVSGSRATAAQLEEARVDVEALQTRLMNARRTRRALLTAKRLCEKRLPRLREAGVALGNAAAALHGAGAAADPTAAEDSAAAAVTAVVNRARRLDELCESLAKASRSDSRRRSTIGGAGTAGAATFGDVRAGFEADSQASSGVTGAAAKDAAAALLGSG